MRISYNWLREYVDLDMTPPQLADRLTMVGLEVEELTDRYEYLRTVVAARVEDVTAHPGSDKLKVCTVFTGQDRFQVVCGAPNVTAGMISAMALPGTTLPSGQVVNLVDIRGVSSNGMLCSQVELIVGPDAAGIMELPADTALGQGMKSVLGLDDWVIELGITPNRPDCLSLLGVAREVAGIIGRRVRYPKTDVVEGTVETAALTSVTIEDPEHCPRYVVRVIRKVEIGPSPFWLVERLAAAGVRSINNVVDITNYVMLETGQPLHAFDMDLLEENRIVVKLADEGDRFTTLDNVERILGPEMLMICDAGRQVGLAGVMGGLNSEIHDQTENVLLESAYFNPVSIRRTSKNLGLSTEASFRFERGADPLGCAYAAERAISLMAEIAGGEVAGNPIDVNPIAFRPQRIPFSPSACNTFLGTDIGAKRMVGSLAGIEMKITGQGDQLTVEPPSFRVDLEREVDLFEEVARLIGYYQIPATLPAARDEAYMTEPSLLLRSTARDTLEGLGLTEVVNYSFLSEDFPDRLKLAEDSDMRRTVSIINPLSEDQSLLRTTLIPGLLDSLRRNQSFGVGDVWIYEIGTLFFDRRDRELPDERMCIAGLAAGSRNELSVHYKPEPVDFYDIKGVVEDLLEALAVPDLVFSRGARPPYYDPGATAEVRSGDHRLGWIGRLQKPVTRSFNVRDVGGDVYAFELDVAALISVRRTVTRFQPLPRFPFVDRDMAVVLDRDIEADRILKYLRSLEEDHLTDVLLFDCFEGRQVGEAKKSLAFRLRYRAADRTMTDEEVNEIHQRITDGVLAEFKAALRT